MKKLLALLALAIALQSCRPQRKEPMLTETGEVVGKQYTPDTRQTVTGTGFSTSGDVIITSHNIGESERYTVVFKCQHGVIFNVNRPEVYAKVREGDSVTIDYYELVDKDGEVQDLDFVDANAQRK